jgi:hypothetical protein
MNNEKMKSRIRNWKEYNQALVNRGSLTFWFSEDIKEEWFFHGKKSGRGTFKTYSDKAIELCLMVKAVFKLPLRGLEGFINSIFNLMGLPLRSPDYSLFSKRAGQLQVQIPRRMPEGAVDVVFDSTGLKVYGEGEWKVREHGASKRRTWRKLHIGANPENGDYVAVELTTVEVGDAQVLPELAQQLGEQKMGCGYGDGAYDTRTCYDAIAKQGGAFIAPPRQNAAYWEAGHPRNQAVADSRKLGRKVWKEEAGYHRRSFAETAIYRFKQLIGACLSARRPDNQGTEAYVGVAVINKMNMLGMPQRA